MVCLSHSGPIYPYAAWLRIRTDIFSTIPVSILLVLKRSSYWSWLTHQNAESFIIWSIMSSWFCHGELGSKRAPITHSSIFTLATKLQHDFALCDVIDSRDLRAGFSRSNSIAEIPECWHAQKTANSILNSINVLTLNIRQSKMYGYWKHILKLLSLYSIFSEKAKKGYKTNIRYRGTEPNSVLGQIQHVTENVVYNNIFNQIQEEEKTT